MYHVAVTGTAFHSRHSRKNRRKRLCQDAPWYESRARSLAANNCIGNDQCMGPASCPGRVRRAPGCVQRGIRFPLSHQKSTTEASGEERGVPPGSVLLLLTCCRYDFYRENSISLTVSVFFVKLQACLAFHQYLFSPTIGGIPGRHGRGCRLTGHTFPDRFVVCQSTEGCCNGQDSQGEAADIDPPDAVGDQRNP
jgi:hypothetical protein